MMSFDIHSSNVIKIKLIIVNKLKKYEFKQYREYLIET